jgi:hypothetical protein
MINVDGLTARPKLEARALMIHHLRLAHMYFEAGGKIGKIVEAIQGADYGHSADFLQPAALAFVETLNAAYAADDERP